jgi:hypothetical protein
MNNLRKSISGDTSRIIDTNKQVSSTPVWRRPEVSDLLKEAPGFKSRPSAPEKYWLSNRCEDNEELLNIIQKSNVSVDHTTTIQNTKQRWTEITKT